MQTRILTIALMGLFSTAYAGSYEQLQQMQQVTSYGYTPKTIEQMTAEARQQQPKVTTPCTSIMCQPTAQSTSSASATYSMSMKQEAAMIANRAESLSSTKTTPLSTIQNVQAQYSTPAATRSSTPVASSTPAKVNTVKKNNVKIATQLEEINKQQQQGNTNVNAAYGQQTAQTAQTQAQPNSGFGLGRIMSGDISAALNVASVIAQETGDEKTAKYLLGAGGLVGAGDVAQEIMSGNVNAATAIKGVASVGAIYAATSGNEQKVRDFGRGAAVLEGLGAYAGGDGVFAGSPTGGAGAIVTSAPGTQAGGNTGAVTTKASSKAANDAWIRTQQAAQKKAGTMNCALASNIATNPDCRPANTNTSYQTINVPGINGVPILK